MKGILFFDPACGSGGFIFNFYELPLDKIDSFLTYSKCKRGSQTKLLYTNYLVWRYFSKLVKITKSKNASWKKMDMAGIEHANGLDSVSKLSAKFNDLCGIGKPSIILTNPPLRLRT